MQESMHKISNFFHDLGKELYDYLPNLGIGAAASGAGTYYSIEFAHKSFDLAISIVTMIILSVGSFFIKEMLNAWKEKKELKKKKALEEEFKKRQDSIGTNL